MDKDYQYALVGSPSRNFLWVLSRQPQLGKETYDLLMKRAEKLGFAVDRMEMIAQGDAVQESNG